MSEGMVKRNLLLEWAVFTRQKNTREREKCMWESRDCC